MLTGLEAQNVSTCSGGRGFNSHPVQKLVLSIIQRKDVQIKVKNFSIRMTICPLPTVAVPNQPFTVAYYLQYLSKCRPGHFFDSGHKTIIGLLFIICFIWRHTKKQLLQLSSDAASRHCASPFLIFHNDVSSWILDFCTSSKAECAATRCTMYLLLVNQ